MTGRIKWLYGLFLLIFLISLYFNWMTHRTNDSYKANAQGSLVLAVGLIGQADASLKKGDLKTATVLGYEGIGYIRASSGGMEQLGVRNVSGLASFLDQSMSNLLGNQPSDATTKVHDEQVIAVLESSFKPFGRINFGSMNDSQLEQAINKVYKAMTPQERQNFEEEGPSN
jgi:hypothetical protein